MRTWMSNTQHTPPAHTWLHCLCMWASTRSAATQAAGPALGLPHDSPLLQRLILTLASYFGETKYAQEYLSRPGLLLMTLCSVDL